MSADEAGLTPLITSDEVMNVFRMPTEEFMTHCELTLGGELRRKNAATAEQVHAFRNRTVDSCTASNGIAQLAALFNEMRPVGVVDAAQLLQPSSEVAEPTHPEDYEDMPPLELVELPSHDVMRADVEAMLRKWLPNDVIYEMNVTRSWNRESLEPDGIEIELKTSSGRTFKTQFATD